MSATKEVNRFTVGSIVMGAGLITIGFALAWHPLGFIAGGAFLLYAGIVSRKGSK
jgi:hypothetical protein